MVQAWSIGTAQRSKPFTFSGTASICRSFLAWSRSVSALSREGQTGLARMVVSFSYFRLGKEQRSKNKKGGSPGPGAYSGDFKVTHKKQPGYLMGLKTNYDFSYLKKTPGPGAYAPNGIKSQTGWSLVGRHEGGKGPSVPGPGQYNAPEGIERSTGKSFGREKRGASEKRSNPGPGQYSATSNEIFKRAAPKFGFGTGG